MDRGMGRTHPKPLAQAAPPQELEGIVRGGKIEFLNGNLPDGTRVQVRVKK